jgi:hypothetical protein
LDHGFGIGHGASHATTYFLGQGKEMGHTGGFHQSIGNLFLSDNADGILATDGDAGQARVGGFKTVFHLIQTALRRENGNVMIIVTKIHGKIAKDIAWRQKLVVKRPQQINESLFFVGTNK